MVLQLVTTITIPPRSRPWLVLRYGFIFDDETYRLVQYNESNIKVELLISTTIIPPSSKHECLLLNQVSTGGKIRLRDITTNWIR
ncbi:hypothetical protein BV898_13754 [Hypsibius exemplaris]|uniref:Uncharacterized protein n=1 Tax=Hypsibius exemplaris TaxID=2072580 RepID=A0A1W0W9S3_HYPEX|nr:hypothetical protein BV898_13754 [Hypsibius exemplaris]